MLNWRDPKNPLAGGAERVTLAYLAGLVRRGHEVYWFAYDYPGASREEVCEGVKVVRGGGMGSSILKAIQWYRKQPHFDLVMDQHHGIPWYSPWWCGTNSISYIHEVLGPIWNAFYSPPVAMLGRFQERWTHWFYRNVPFWTASDCTKSILEKHGVRSIQIIRYGVYTQALPALEPKKLDVPLRLIVVSRLAPNKRIDHSIRVIKALNHLSIPSKLTVVGFGEEEGRLKQLTAELKLQDQVEFTGGLSEVEKDARLRGAHFLIHNSIREGWGLNVIEANAMGTPGLVYPVEGLVESTLHDQTGIVCEKETPESMAAAVQQLLKTPEKFGQYRLQAWERAKTLHWDRIIPQACNWLEAQAKRNSR